MTALIIAGGAVVGFVAALAVLAVVGAARGKQTPPNPLFNHATDWPDLGEELRATQPFEPGSEQAIDRLLAAQDQPIQTAGPIDELTQRRNGSTR